jgi:hypothetical protein
MGTRARNGLPGGVLAGGDHRCRFGENPGIPRPPRVILSLLRLFKRKLDLLKILIFNIKQTYYELLNANGALFKSNNHQMLSMDMQILKE